MYWKLFSSFFKLGLFTFGGGYAMYPLLQREIVTENQWASETELMDYYAISQVVPGIISVNTANFIGYRQKGRLGSLAAVMGFLMPSIIIIFALFSLLTQFSSHPVVQNAFAGIRLAVCALVLHAVIKMAAIGLVDGLTVGVFVVTILMILIFSLNPIYIVIAGAVLGGLVRLNRDPA